MPQNPQESMAYSRLVSCESKMRRRLLATKGRNRLFPCILKIYIDYPVAVIFVVVMVVMDASVAVL